MRAEEVLEVGFELFLAEVYFVASVGWCDGEHGIFVVYLVDGNALVEQCFCFFGEVCFEAICFAAGDDYWFVGAPLLGECYGKLSEKVGVCGDLLD